MLRVEGVSVRFGATVALDHVSLDLAAGERLALLGPSGCGKSTLLRAIAGLETGDGRIVIDADDLTGKPPDQRPVGLMFQDHVLFPHRTVAGNIGFGLRMEGVTSAVRAERVFELLALVGLDGFADRDVATLSGGEAQRVALARALAPAPRVLLLDEPLGSLERYLRARLIAELPDVLAATGTAAIHVTHDHDEAFALGDRVAVMAAGRVLCVDTPAVVWRRPVSAEAARVLGHENLIAFDDATELWRPDAATLDPDGPVEAVVERVHFRGVDSEVLLRRPDGSRLRFVFAEPPAVGTAVRLRIDAARVVRWGSDPV